MTTAFDNFYDAPSPANAIELAIADHAQGKLNKALADCREKHGNAHYRKGLLDSNRPSISVFYTNESEIKPLSEVSQ